MIRIKDTVKNPYHICFALIVLALAAMPILSNAGMLTGTALIIFLGKTMALIVLAIGLDLIWGYAGILSLGHGLWFALGGYCMGMYLKMVATNGNITEFMHTGGLTELPLIWRPFLSLPLTILLIFLVPGVLSFVIGFAIFKNRVKGVYFTIITQALTWAAYSIFIAMSPYTNGNIGISEIRSILGSVRGQANAGTLFTLYFVALGIVILVYVFANYLTATKYGKVLIAIRDGENRTNFSGYNVSMYKTFIYVVSALLAALGGAVFVNFNGTITPSQMTITYSINIVIWVAIGGRGTIVGAVIGTLLINLCEYNLSSGGLVDIWQFVIGGIFCLAILFFKGGIVGIFKDQIPALIRRLRGKEIELDEDAEVLV
jgi:urea transport system permease protein